MTPEEIESHLDREIKASTVSRHNAKFVEQLRVFVQTEIVAEVERTRRSIGLKIRDLTKEELEAENADE